MRERRSGERWHGSSSSSHSDRSRRDRDRDRSERIERTKSNYGRIDSSTGGYAEYEGALNDAAGLSHKDVLSGRSYRDYERKDSDREIGSSYSRPINQANEPSTPQNTSPAFSNTYSRQGGRISHSVQTSRQLLGGHTKERGIWGQSLANISKNASPADYATMRNDLFSRGSGKVSPNGTPEEIEAWDKAKRAEAEIAKKWYSNNQISEVGNFVGGIVSDFAPPLIPAKNMVGAVANLGLNKVIGNGGGILKSLRESGQFNHLTPVEKTQAEQDYQRLNERLANVKANRSWWEKGLRNTVGKLPVVGDIGTLWANGKEFEKTLDGLNNPYVDQYLREQANAKRIAQQEAEARRKDDRGEPYPQGLLPTLKAQSTPHPQPNPNEQAAYYIPGIANLWNIKVEGDNFNKYLTK